ncbi:MAG: ABC transporter ATP-binding protein [Desulfarculus sp.]|nr:ABC transporter ATP-binding protein [Desulfarculus sp.]
MEALLKVEDLDMSFGGVQALSEVSFTAPAGRITAVIGPNGAGKTTAINCISGVYRPQGGAVLFGGRPITGLAPHVLARQGLTRTFQNLQALEFLGLSASADLPAGQLSYGDRKRVELARALVARPKMVLLDEPVAGLNPAETEEMGRVLLEVRRQGVGLLLVEHDMSLVMRVSDQVVVLHFGRQIAQGDPRAIQRHPEVLRTYLGGHEDIPPSLAPAPEAPRA